jgi:biopolymer transport protein ExbD
MAMSVPTDDEDGEVMCEMNTTPLIDVMLVLLIMLIITIPIQTHAVKLNMPSNSSSAPSEPPKVVQIAILADGTVKWDGESVGDRKDLESRISEAARESPQPEVHIRADAATKYQVVAMVMASSQRLGLTKIGVTGNEAFR